METTIAIALKILSVFTTFDCLLYLLLLYLLGLIALPLCFGLLHRTRIAWFVSAKFVGLGLLTWVAWVGAHGPLAYRMVTLWGLVIMAAAGSVWLARRTFSAMHKRCREHWRPIVTAEIVFLFAFAFCCVLRMHSDGIKDTEKYMDLAFLNACVSSASMPLPDPWLYDGPANYYYGGHLQIATLAKMTFVRPEVAYNISIAVVFAFVCQLVFALSWELTRRKRWALLGVCLVALMGNLDVAQQNWEYWVNLDEEKTFEVEEWRASRVIHDGPIDGEIFETINEFPFFSFLHADLHAHVTALPTTLLLLLILWNYFRSSVHCRGAYQSLEWRWARVLFMAWALGSLALINGFDFLTFCVLVPLFLVAREWSGGRGWNRFGPFIGMSVLKVGLVLALALLSYLPFFLNYTPPSAAKNETTIIQGVEKTVGLLDKIPFGVTEFRSNPGEFFTVWGTHLLILAGFILVVLIRESKHYAGESRTFFWYVLIGFFLLLLAASGLFVVTFLLVLLGGVLFSLHRSRKSPAMIFAHVAVTFVLSILLFCEKFHFKDGLGAGYDRLNTLFKFYYPCWVILGACLPLFLREILRSLDVPKWVRYVAVALPFCLIFWAMEFPVVTTLQRVRNYNPNYSGELNLDGMKHLSRDYPGDYAAIVWLRKNATPNQVVLEANDGGYSHYSRIATHTQLRCVLGWSNHQAIWRGYRPKGITGDQPIWRGSWPLEIEADIDAIYNAEDAGSVRLLIEKYKIDYVIIGTLENMKYSKASLDRLEGMCEMLFEDQASGTLILRPKE